MRLSTIYDEWEEYRQEYRQEYRPEYRPGQETEDGEIYEPDAEPVDWDEWLLNVFERYGASGRIDGASGFLLTSGRAVQMGMGLRYEDHRFAIPSEIAMQKWGWPTDVIRQSEQGTSGPALRELLARSGAMRIGVSDDYLWAQGEQRPSTRQIEAILDFVMRVRPEGVRLELPGLPAGGVELAHPDALEVEQALLGKWRRR